MASATESTVLAIISAFSVTRATISASAMSCAIISSLYSPARFFRLSTPRNEATPAMAINIRNLSHAQLSDLIQRAKAKEGTV